MPEAEYGGNRFTPQDIVFSVVPANAGPQTQAPPGTSPTVPLTSAFTPDFSKSPAILGDFKKALALDGPASGFQVKPGVSKVTSPTRNYISPSS